MNSVLFPGGRGKSYHLKKARRASADAHEREVAAMEAAYLRGRKDEAALRRKRKAK
jgi:hypothetical protein